MVSGLANANDAYAKISVSAPAILGEQITFTITMQRNCSQYDNWHYTIQNSTQLFHNDDNTTIIRKDKKYLHVDTEEHDVSLPQIKYLVCM